ncbi:hypothetical protein TWF696_006824 [Orbilia brochopaga]|uniref:Alcohol acetyltransferase n=1 Tax=Orbilia brochopaga TaxID=3140254 RepID=A0AAV9UTN0_9PEZI
MATESEETKQAGTAAEEAKLESSSSSSDESDDSEILRAAGLLERYHIIRSSIAWYNNVIVGASYSTPTALTVPTFIRALHSVIAQHPILASGIRLPSSSSKAPSFIRLPRVDFSQHGLILWESSGSAASHGRDLRDLIVRLHNTPFPNDKLDSTPAWRIAVLQRSYNVPTAYDSSTNAQGRYDYEILFCFHHAIADGLSGAAFHYSLLDALATAARDDAASTSGYDVYNVPEDLELLPAMDDVVDLGLGIKTAGRIASYLGKAIVPSFLRKQIWTAGKIGDSLAETKVQILQVDAKALLTAVKAHKVSITAFITYAAAHALYASMAAVNASEHGKMKTVRVSLPMSYRRSAGWGNDVMVDCVGALDWDIHAFDNLHREVHAMKKLTKEVRVAAGATRDSEVGLLALVGDMEGFFRGQVGKERGLTFEVSNLGVWDKEKVTAGGEADDWRIEQAVFSQSSSVAGPAFSVNVATVGERMVVGVQWMDGVVGDKVMESLVGQLETDIATFGKKK